MKRSPLETYVMPVVTTVTLIAAWWAYTRFSGIPPYILPSPQIVFSELVRLFTGGEIWPHLGHTLGIIASGFAIGSVTGFALGFVLAKSPRAEAILSPYLLFFQTAPKIAFAPLFILWFGLGLTSKIVLVVSLVFFPVMIGTLLGLKSLSGNLRELCRILKLTTRQRLFRSRAAVRRAGDLRRAQGRRDPGDHRRHPGGVAVGRYRPRLSDGVRRHDVQDAAAVRDGAGDVAARHLRLPASPADRTLAVVMALKQRSAAWPWKEGVPTHIPLPSPVPRGFLLPGDPARVDIAAEVLGDFTIVGQNREFRMATGRYDGVTIGVCSTGIGGASTEIVMVELAALGVGHIVRTGGMGALADDLSLGDFLIADAALANSACARWYAPGSDLVKADRSLAERLEAARTGLGLGGRRGTCLTADGYYRAGASDRLAARATRRFSIASPNAARTGSRWNARSCSRSAPPSAWPPAGCLPSMRTGAATAGSRTTRRRSATCCGSARKRWRVRSMRKTTLSACSTKESSNETFTSILKGIGIAIADAAGICAARRRT